jgi:hypothetical protein
MKSKARSGSSSRGREKISKGMKSVLPRSPGSLFGHCCITPAKLQHHKTCPLQINAYQGIEQEGIIEILKIVFPYVIVLTQDCDLNQDYTVRWGKNETSHHDKKIISVIVAPLYNAEHLYTGEHLSELKMKMAKINKEKTPGKTLRQN